LTQRAVAKPRSMYQVSNLPRKSALGMQTVWLEEKEKEKRKEKGGKKGEEKRKERKKKRKKGEEGI
jgi:hypothetical protein